MFEELCTCVIKLCIFQVSNLFIGIFVFSKLSTRSHSHQIFSSANTMLQTTQRLQKKPQNRTRHKTVLSSWYSVRFVGKPIFSSRKQPSNGNWIFQEFLPLQKVDIYVRVWWFSGCVLAKDGLSNSIEGSRLSEEESVIENDQSTSRSWTDWIFETLRAISLLVKTNNKQRYLTTAINKTNRIGLSVENC